MTDTIRQYIYTWKFWESRCNHVVDSLQTLEFKYKVWPIKPPIFPSCASVNKSAMLGNSGSSITKKNLSFGQTFKLKFPNFNGKDPNSWIYSVEEYQV